MNKQRHETTPLWRTRFVLACILGLIAIAGLAFAACGDDDDDDDGDGEPEPTEAMDGTEAPDGDGDSLLDQAREAGVLTVGIANEAPYGFEDEEGNVTGEAPEVARVVLAELGIPEIDAVVVDFGQLQASLNAGQFDMIAAGMFITAERVEDTLFTDPDYCASQALAVAAGNPLGLTDYDSIAANDDAILGVLGGAVEEGYAEEAGVPADRIETFDTTPNLFEGLIDERIDALGLTGITVNWQIQQIGNPAIEATEGFLPVVEGEEVLGCGGYGFRFEDQEFRDEFNRVLNEMKDNGEILPIVEEFGFTAADVEAAVGVTVEDLVGDE